MNRHSESTTVPVTEPGLQTAIPEKRDKKRTPASPVSYFFIAGFCFADRPAPERAPTKTVH